MNEKGELGSGLTEGTRTFDRQSGLSALDVLDPQKGPKGNGGKKILEKGVAVDPGADGIVAWGRWIDGDAKLNDSSGSGKGKVATLHYFAFAGQPALPVIASFSSFASTAPTIASGGKLVAKGEVNSASGTVNAAFLTIIGGSATYSLVVPVPGQTFSLTGRAVQISKFGFAGISDIRSTGTACDAGCPGTLGHGVSVNGLIGGSAGNRIGVTYGFDSRLGNVSGVIVFKR